MMSARAGLIRRRPGEAPERETEEQTIRRLGSETAEQSRVRLGLEEAKQRRRRITLKAVGSAVVVAVIFIPHAFEGGRWTWRLWHLSRASWYRAGLIAAGVIVVVLIAANTYRKRGAAS